MVICLYQVDKRRMGVFVRSLIHKRYILYPCELQWCRNLQYDLEQQLMGVSPSYLGWIVLSFTGEPVVLCRRKDIVRSISIIVMRRLLCVCITNYTNYIIGRETRRDKSMKRAR